jgi:hypothetical protein
MNMGKLVKTTIGTWATLTEGTQWLIATHFLTKTEADKIINFSLAGSLTILNSYIILSSQHSFSWLWFGFWK